MSAIDKTAQGAAVLEASGNAGAEAARRRRRLLMERCDAQLGKYQTPESSRAVLTDLTPATPAEGALEGSASEHAAVLDPSPAGSGGPQHQDTPRPGKGAKCKRSGRKWP